MNDNLYTVKNFSQTENYLKILKTILLLAVWEYRSENHLWELLLKKPKEFDGPISSGKFFHRSAPL